MGKRAIRFYDSNCNQAIGDLNNYIKSSEVDFLYSALLKLEKISLLDWIIRKETSAVKGISILDDWGKLHKAAKKLGLLYHMQKLIPADSEIELPQMNDQFFSRYNKNFRQKYDHLLLNDIRNKKQLEFLLEALESKLVSKRLFKQLKIAEIKLSENYPSDSWIDAAQKIKRVSNLSGLLSPYYLDNLNENCNRIELDLLSEVIEKWQHVGLMHQWIRGFKSPNKFGLLNLQVQLEKDSFNYEMEIRSMRNHIFKKIIS